MTLDGFRREVRVALRSLGRSPGFAFSTVAILALAIGLSTAMFSVYKAVIADRLPVLAQDRLVVMHPLDRANTHLDVPYPYLAELARDTSVFAGVAGVYHLGAQPGPYMDGDRSIQLGVLNAATNFFAVLGMRPALGRFFRPEDGQAGAPVVIVLGHDAWVRRFNADSAVIGHTLVMPYWQTPARIIGVAPPGFSYPDRTDGWMPIPPDFKAQVDIIVRLARRATMASAHDAALAMMQRSNPFMLAELLPGAQRDPKQFQIFGIEARPLTETILGNSRPVIIALTLAVALLLLIACVNVGNLALVRAFGRAREIAVRRAMGASVPDVIRLFLAENGLLAVIGGALGFAAALALLRGIRIAAPSQLPRIDTIGYTSTASTIAIGVTLVALILFGLAPSLIASQVSSYFALRSDVRSGEGYGRRRTRRWLVSLQIALAVVLLAGAGLLVRTLARLEAMNLGYRPEHVSMLSYTGPQSALANPKQIFAASKALVAQLEATPGVIAATPVESRPFEGQSLFIMRVAAGDAPASEREQVPWTPFEFVGPNYFKTFDIPIRRGRAFRASDVEGANPVVVISETLAKRLWPNQDPIGKRLVQTINNSTWTVIGVASDTHLRELRSGGPIVYYNGDQVTPFWNGFIAVRSSALLASMMPAFRRASRDANPNLVLFEARTMDELIAEPMSQPRLSALLLATFSVVALLLSAIGLYGVMTSVVRQQTRDMGVRLALGATAGDVTRLVLGDALRVVIAGAVIGVAGAVAGGRLLASQLYGVRSIDPVSLGVTSLMLFGAAAVAAFMPARRAARIDPVMALRAE
ncbi:MAG: ADOP family duplicated permease [Gemmatimonadaceae bacterium]